MNEMVRYSSISISISKRNLYLFKSKVYVFLQTDDSSLQEMSPDFQKKRKINVRDVFNQDEEDDGFGAKKRKLIPLG